MPAEVSSLCRDRAAAKNPEVIAEGEEATRGEGACSGNAACCREALSRHTAGNRSAVKDCLLCAEVSCNVRGLRIEALS